MGITFRELGPETWGDFAALFGKYRGVRGGCWCTCFLLSFAEFERRGRAGRREFQRRAVLAGRSHGVLALEGDRPVGWCQYGPREDLSRLDRNRIYARDGLGAVEGPLWRITCFFVDRERRRTGLTGRLLREALASIRRRGGGTVEAVPFVIPGAGGPSFTGALSTFEKAGFRPLRKVEKHGLLVRRTVRGRR